MALKDKIPLRDVAAPPLTRADRHERRAPGCAARRRARLPRPVGDREHAGSRLLVRPEVILTYAAAVTRSIRVGVSVAVLPVQNPIHVAHQIATLDYTSNGRAILGVGLGRDQHYTEFQVPMEHRVRRFREGVELIRALWTQPKIDYAGSIYHLDGRRWRSSPCRSRIRRSGSAAGIPTRSAAPPRWPTDGWARAARAMPTLAASSPCYARPEKARA